MNELLKKYKNHLIGFLAICAISAAYLPGVFQGKGIAAGDIVQYQGAASEIKSYSEKGEHILWTNSQFSGMPVYQISTANFDNPIRLLRYPKSPKVWEKLFLYMFCSYIMFIAFGVRPWLAVIGSIAMSFVSGNVIIIEAGHNTKALAIAYAPLIIAGVQYMFRKRWLLGFNLVAFGMALQLFMNHVQITYYTGMIIGVWMIFKLAEAIKEKDLQPYFKTAGLALGAVILAIGANSVNLMLTQEYLPHTIRGKTELTIQPDQKPIEKASDGLSYEYAFQWSNSWDDVLAMFIPNYAGGGSQEGTYFGELPFTNGPQYMGVTILFLCVLGFVLVKGVYRWWILVIFLLGIALSMGKNHFVWLNEFFFNHVPFYNKFRAPTMALILIQMSLPILAILGLNSFLNKENKEQFKLLKYAGYGFGGFLIILTFLSSTFNDFRTEKVLNEQGVAIDNDSRLFEQTAQQYKTSPQQVELQIIERRMEVQKKDGYRSILLVAAVFFVLWFYHKGSLNRNLSLGILGVLVLFDLWGIDKRYLSDDNLIPISQTDKTVQPSQADLAIMQDAGYNRVLDLTSSPMMSARASNFHYSLGGYNAAKIRRYQELFDWYVYKELNGPQIFESPYLSMLNMKYLIFKNQQNGELMYQASPNPLGNAWFVNEVKMVDNPDACIIAMKDLKPESFALVEQKHADRETAGYGSDSTASIELTSYHPEEMKYSSVNSQKGFAVFSEIYYEDGWNAYLDGELVPHAQVNYILRGLEIPAGTHEIVFKFEPETFKKGMMITNICSGLIFLIFIGSVGISFRNKQKEAA